MLTLNLLPLQEKKNLEIDIHQRLVLALALAIIFTLGIFSLLLYSATLYINIQLEPILDAIEIEEQREEAREARGIEGDILSLTRTLERTKGVILSEERWSAILKELATLPHEGITFRTVILKLNEMQSPEGGTSLEREVTILGHAVRREEHFVPFERALRAHPKIQNVISPTSNIIKEEDINFTLSFSILP